MEGGYNMEKVAYFDYCAFILTIIIFASIFFRKMTHGKINRYFLITVLVSFLTIIFDIWAITLDNLPNPNVEVKYIVHSSYLFFHSLTIPVYIAYLVAMTDTWHKLRTNIIHAILLPLPLIIIVILLIINALTQNVFYLNENYMYCRGKLFPLVYVAGFMYAIYGVSYICYYKKLFKTSRFWALMSIFMLVLFATIFQMIYPKYPVEMFATSVGLLFIAILIQRPEEHIDVITGLHKLTGYTADIKRGFANGKHIHIILINIANFNSIRDMLGFDETNTLLHRLAIKFADLNKKNKLNADLYYLDKGRFRFVIDSDYANNIEEIASIINEALKPGINIKHMDINLIAHICIGRCPEDFSDYESLMYFGERFSIDNEYTGEVVYAKDLFKKEQFDLHNNLDSIIENAITNRKFQVYYQPIYSIKEKRFNSAEALLRLIDDDYGFIPPDVFIPAAEKSGAIHKIGAYVLDEVCQFISSSDFPKLNIDYIEINLSVAQCMHKGLPKLVLDTLERYHVSPDKINLEITETAASYSQNIMAENIETLNASGISFSLDDYGTGYSNIQRVSTLPLKIVKLDRTFVNVEDNPKMFIVLENTIKMLKDMEMEIVAEGIETEHLVKKFSDMKCEYIQGYYFSKPIPKNDFIAFITMQNKNK